MFLLISLLSLLTIYVHSSSIISAYKCELIKSPPTKHAHAPYNSKCKVKTIKHN